MPSGSRSGSATTKAVRPRTSGALAAAILLLSSAQSAAARSGLKSSLSATSTPIPIAARSLNSRAASAVFPFKL
jgi:hypothetical protein